MLERHGQLSFVQSINIVALYCLPAILVLVYVLYGYKGRTSQVENHIMEVWDVVVEQYSRHMDNGSAIAEIEKELCADKAASQSILNGAEVLPIAASGLKENCKLERYVIREYIRLGGRLGREGESQAQQKLLFNAKVLAVQGKLEKQVFDIWFSNSLVISVMVLVPFAMLGSAVAFSKGLCLNYEQRLKLMFSGWWMKAIVALVVAYGWMYLVNPDGRGGSTVEQFLITADLSQSRTIPLFLRDFTVTPVIAGFLGWYLYMLTYYFSKIASGDVVSTKVYGVLLQKCLFAWGVTIVFVAAQMQENANIIAFLVGYFPMTAFSLVKDKGLSLLQGKTGQYDKGQLSELPGISRMQVMRLEEEGINSLGELAYRQRGGIDQYLPGMAKLVDYWADIARLYSIVGEDSYAKVRTYCQTASEFIVKVEDPAFKDALAALGIYNTEEYARILVRTFPDLGDGC